MLALLLPCVGAWAEIEVSTSIDSPEATYSLLSKNGAYMSAGTGATQFYIGRFAFYATDVANAYKIYSVDAQKWVSYTKSGSYADGPNKATLIDSQADAHAWNVVANGNYYNIAPYRTDNAVAGRYWNFHGGAGASGKTYIYDDNKTVGFYNEKGDGGSLWTLEKLTLATEEQVNEAKALVVVGLGYPKTTTSVYNAVTALTVGKSTTKHVTLAKEGYISSTDILLPEDGKAYKMALVAPNGNEYHLTASGNTRNVSTDAGVASTFYCKHITTSAGLRYVFISEDGKILAYRSLTDSYTYSGNLLNNCTIEAMVGKSSGYITSDKIKRLGKVCITTEGRADDNGSAGCFILKYTVNPPSFDNSSAPYHNNTYTSAIKIIEVKNYTPNQNQIAAIANVDLGVSKLDATAMVNTKTPGANLGQYTYTINDVKSSDANAIKAAINGATTIETIDHIIASATLNAPKTGKFYRLKNYQSNWYATSDIRTGESQHSNKLWMANETNTARTIWYLTAENKLLSYTKGQYMGDMSSDWSFEEIGAAGNIVTFNESDVVGKYQIIPSSGRALYGDQVRVDAAGAGNKSGNYAWILEEVTELPVTVTSAGYATFYAPVAVQVTGVTANTVTVNGEWATLNEIEGGVVPAETGVILNGEAGTYNFAITTAEALDDKGALLGTVATTMVAESAYVLSAPEGVVGLYLANANPFKNNAFKAYLPATAVSSSAQALRFTFGGTTAIESVINNNANAPIYDLSGRRVNNAVKGGIYIQNGKKFIVK